MPRLAAHGFARIPYAIASPVGALTGTSATVIQGAKALGFRYRIESAHISAQAALAGGTRTVQVKKGSTVLFSLAVGATNLGTIGNIVDMTAAVGPESREFGDADTLLVDVASGGTSVTAGAFNVLLILRELPQAAA